MDGIILLDKPQNVTSQAAVTHVRRLCGASKAGHAGTLDPIATGLLPICLDRGTRLCEFLLADEKTYLAELLTGGETDSGDITGKLTEKRNPCDNIDDIAAVLPQFTGVIEQIPPMYSAIKIGGRKMYELARKGETAELAPRRVTVYTLELMGRTSPGRYSLRARVSKGTYIRSLLRDIGRAVGCLGTMSALRRETLGGFTLAGSVTYDDIEKRLNRGDDSFILPLETPFLHMFRLEVDETGRSMCANGVDVKAAHWLNAPPDDPMPVRVHGPDGRLAAIGRVEGGIFKADKNF